MYNTHDLEHLYDNLDVPILNVKNRTACTDYIDFLEWDEVSEPIMKGTDKFTRKFIVIKMIIFINNSNNMKIMQTFFQRYTDGYGWQGCGHATKTLIDTVGGIYNEQYNLIRDIIAGKSVTITEKHRPNYSHFIGNIVCLYEEKKTNAAIIIQKAFRKYRYDPQFKFCAQVQDNNFKMMGNDWK